LPVTRSEPQNRRRPPSFHFMPLHKPFLAPAPFS
jgi:hypothetical protein